MLSGVVAVDRNIDVLRIDVDLLRALCRTLECLLKRSRDDPVGEERGALRDHLFRLEDAPALDQAPLDRHGLEVERFILPAFQFHDRLSWIGSEDRRYFPVVVPLRL